MNKIEKIIVYFCIIIVTIVSICSIETNGKSNFMDIDIGQVLSILITGVVFFNITNVIAFRGKK